MAGKGGGAWKVAYADFVTAMMAFFLVMWIVTQDKKLKEAVAHYFVDPMGYYPLGSSNNPAKNGALFDSEFHGRVPDAQAVSMGKGRHSFSGERRGGKATRLVNNAIQADSQAASYWQEKGDDIKRMTGEQSDTRNKSEDERHQLAAQELGRQMKEKVTADINKLTPVYQELLFAAFAEVNWTEVAEEMLDR